MLWNVLRARVLRGSADVCHSLCVAGVMVKVLALDKEDAQIPIPALLCKGGAGRSLPHVKHVWTVCRKHPSTGRARAQASARSCQIHLSDPRQVNLLRIVPQTILKLKKKKKKRCPNRVRLFSVSTAARLWPVRSQSDPRSHCKHNGNVQVRH